MKQAAPYVVFLAFCVLTATRDSLSELLFKNETYEAHPTFVLFIYSVTTQIAAVAVLAATRARMSGPAKNGALADVVLLNLFTLTAFLSFFLAINTPLGAGLNSFIDYGSGPLFTALAGALILGEGLGRRFFASMIACALGLYILTEARVGNISMTGEWIAGICLALVSSASSAMYRIYSKRLLNRGMAKAEIVIWRLVALSVSLAIFLMARTEYVRTDLLLPVAVLGLVGFALPLFLALFVLQKLPIANFAILLFLVPVFTFVFSAILGYVTPRPMDILGAGLVLIGVLMHEKGSGYRRTAATPTADGGR